MLLLRGLAYLWAGPGSLVGLAVILAARLRPRLGVRRHEGTLEALGGALATMMDRLSRGQLEALTLGHVILARDAATLSRFREHERVHVRQWARWGPLFMLAYPLASLWAWMRGLGAYRGNRFEREAWRAGPAGPAPVPPSAIAGVVHDERVRPLRSS